MSKNVQYNEMNDILSRTNKSLGAKIGELEVNLSLAHTQIDMLQERLRDETGRHEETKKQLASALEDLKKLTAVPEESPEPE